MQNDVNLLVVKSYVSGNPIPDSSFISSIQKIPFVFDFGNPTEASDRKLSSRLWSTVEPQDIKSERTVFLMGISTPNLSLQPLAELTEQVREQYISMAAKSGLSPHELQQLCQHSTEQMREISLLSQDAHRTGIPAILCSAARRLGTLLPLLKAWKKIQADPYLSDAYRADIIRRGLGLSDQFFPQYWNALGSEANQWLYGVCHALTCGVTVQDLQFAAKAFCLSDLLDIINDPKKLGLSTEKQQELDRDGKLVELIVDIAVYQVPKELFQDSVSFQVRQQWRLARRMGVPFEFLIADVRCSKIADSLAKICKGFEQCNFLDGFIVAKLALSENLDKAVSLLETHYWPGYLERLWAQDVPFAACISKMQELGTRSTSWKVDSRGELITPEGKWTGLMESRLGHAIEMAQRSGIRDAYQLITVNTEGFPHEFIMRCGKEGVTGFYITSKILGKGSGQEPVYKVVDIRTGAFWALKRDFGLDIDMLKDSRRMLLHEIKVLNEIHDIFGEDIEGVQGRPYEVFNIRGFKVLIGYLWPIFAYSLQDLKDKDTLQTAFDPHDPKSLKKALKICTQLISGLDTIHKSGYFHQDLYSGNMGLFIEGEVMKAVIFDFGLSEKYGNDPIDKLNLAEEKMMIFSFCLDFLKNVVKQSKVLFPPEAIQIINSIICPNTILHAAPASLTDIVDQLRQLSQRL